MRQALILLVLGVQACVTPPTSIQAKLSALEAEFGGRLGVSAYYTSSATRVQYREDERFPMCSTFKTMAVAAVLHKDLVSNGLLAKEIKYSKKDVIDYSPITEKQTTMTVGALCAATIEYSDNAAANLLMKELGGPHIVTSYARSIGDKEFRLDRWEPELNAAVPGDPRDTTTPAAMEKSLYELIFGEAMGLEQRTQLSAWLKGNTTGDTRIRAGVPKGWIVGDKTGSCGNYGTANDIGIIWPPNGGAPIVLAVFHTQSDKDARSRSDVIAAVTRIVVGEVK